jgi:hypothetical protein
MSRDQSPGEALRPPLSVIERELFGPSEALLEAWRQGQVDAATRAALEADPEARALKEGFDGGEGSEAAPSGVAEAPEVGTDEGLPAPMLDLIRRGRAAHEAAFPTEAGAGQVRLVDRVVGLEGPMDWDLPRALAVMLLEATETPDVWYGFLAAPEVDYASPWDVLLEADGDEPFDPLAGMIQVWNPVYVYLPSTGRPLAQLSTERVAAVRSVANELLTGAEPDPTEARPGRVDVRETPGGYAVITGTPLGETADPRHRFQALYHAAAEAVRAPAREAVAAAAPADDSVDSLAALIGRLAAGVLAGLKERARELGDDLVPVPEVAHAMGETGEAEWFRIGDRLRVRLQEGEQGLAVRVRYLGEGECPVIHRREGLPPERQVLDASRPDTELVLDPAVPGELEVRYRADHPLVLRFPEDAHLPR